MASGTSTLARVALAERQESRTPKPTTAFQAHAMCFRNPNEPATTVAGGSSHEPPAARPMHCTVDKRDPPAHYPFKYPISFYGPYGEILPRITSLAQLNTVVSKNAAAGSELPLNTTTNGGGSSGILQTSNSLSLASSINMGGGVETRSLHELCALSRRSDAAGAFAAEWESVSRMDPSNLSRIAVKLQALDSIALAFAAFVQPTASKIVEELSEPLHRRTVRSLPSVDHCYIVAGLIYTVVQNPFSLWVYGSHEAAGRAAANEIRAVRTILGNPMFRTRPPLCCTVTHMGSTVFVSAPLPIPTGVHHFRGLLYGGFNHQYVASDPLGTYCSAQIAEFFPLARHASPHQGVSTWTSSSMKFFQGDDASTVWALDCAGMLPTAVVQYEELSKSKSRDDGSGGRGLSRHPVEDELNSRLSVLLRPEFLHNACVVQMNADAGAPWLPPSSLEHTAHSVHHLYSQSSWLIANELLTLEHAKQLTQSDIATIFHRNGVNLRYLGRVYLDVESGGGAKNTDFREAVKLKLAFEAAARSFKAILYSTLASEASRHGEDAATATLQLFRQLLLCVPNALDFFWNNGPMKKVMQAKYGFYVCPVSEPPVAGDQDGADGGGMPRDGSLRIYRTLHSGKRRVERPPTTLTWSDNGAGSVVLGEEGMKHLLNITGNDGLNVVFPLLGAGSRHNALFFQLVMLRCHLDIVTDLRGKKLVVTFKPHTKPSTALLVSDTMQALVDNNAEAGGLASQLEKTVDDPVLCDLVEPAARKELTLLTKIADSDPRATLPLCILAHANIGRGNYPQAYNLLNRWIYLKRTSPVDCVAGYSLLEAGYLFHKAMRSDKAETILVEGLQLVRTSTLGINIASFIDMVVHTVQCVSQFVWDGAPTRPPADRLLRMLEYLYYAAHLAEAEKLHNLWRPLRAIAVLRKRMAEATACWQCARPATAMITSDVDPTEKPPIDRDLASTTNSKALTGGAGSAGGGAGALSQMLQRRGTNPLQRRRRDDAKKTDEDEAEVFVKRTLEKIDTLFLDVSSVIPGAHNPSPLTPALLVVSPAGGGSPAAPNSPDAALAASGKTASNATASHRLGHAALSKQLDQLDASDLPPCAALADVHKPLFLLARSNRFFCHDCLQKRIVAAAAQASASAHAPPGAIEKQPLTADLVVLFSQVTKLLLGVNAAVRAADAAVLGESLLALGVLQVDIETVGRAVGELTHVFGHVTHAVMRAKLHLAEVTMLRSQTSPAAAEVGKVHDVSILMRAEDVLRETLTTLLETEETRSEFPFEIAAVVRKLQDIAATYADYPVAKKEHQALHYLSDELAAALGTGHPLVASAYAQLKAYYTALSKKRADRFACSTALFSAGKFACLWLESRVTHPDVALEVESQLTDISDNIIKPLRAGTASERQAATELFTHVKRIVANSAYATDATVSNRLSEIAELFRSHLKVMEHTDAVRALREEVQLAAIALRQAAARVKLHRKRTDQYGIHIVSEMLEVRNGILARTKKTLDADLQADVQALCDLYAALTKTPKGSAHDGSHGDTSGDENDDPAGINTSSNGKGNHANGTGKGGNGANAGGGSDGGNGSGAATAASSGDGSSGNQQQATKSGKQTFQTSIYACLDPAPTITEVHSPFTQSTAATGSNGKRPVPGTPSSSKGPGGRLGGHASLATRGLSTWAGASSKQVPVSSAQQTYLSHLGQSKQPETLENIAKLLPVMARSLESKNYNPVREH